MLLVSIYIDTAFSLNIYRHLLCSCISYGITTLYIALSRLWGHFIYECFVNKLLKREHKSKEYNKKYTPLCLRTNFSQSPTNFSNSMIDDFDFAVAFNEIIMYMSKK